jgi:formylglycine-generating enzyme required for sulfatase activity
VRIPAGRATLGADKDEIPFGWDNEFPRHVVDVPAFSIDMHSVTNGEYLEFLQANEEVGHPVFWEREGGTWFWRGQWERVPLPLSWPVWVSHAEASAYARWKGRRLPTEAEYHRAAFGTPGGSERPFPWGDAPPDATRGNFDFERSEPVPAGSRPAGSSAWGARSRRQRLADLNRAQLLPGLFPCRRTPVLADF